MVSFRSPSPVAIVRLAELADVLDEHERTLEEFLRSQAEMASIRRATSGNRPVAFGLLRSIEREV